MPRAKCLGTVASRRREIMDILSELPAGKALDLGCGSGTVIPRHLAKGLVSRRHRLRAARYRLGPRQAGRVSAGLASALLWRRHASRRTGWIATTLRSHHRYRLWSQYRQTPNTVYARGIAGQLKVDGVFMLYASHPRPESSVGWTPKQVEQLFGNYLELYWEQRGADVAIGAPSSWYRMRKRR